VLLTSLRTARECAILKAYMFDGDDDGALNHQDNV